MRQVLMGCMALAAFAVAAAAQDEAKGGDKEAANRFPPPGGLVWDVAGLKVKLGGYVKLDLIHDFNPNGTPDSFDPRSIPVHGDPTLADSNTEIHARQTRLNLDVSGPSSAGPFRLFIEGDFFGSGNGFRMRHAYGTIGFEPGTLLAGQTWTTFMDDAAMPETIDFESPIAFPQLRQAQARFTKQLGDDGDYFAVSLEDPTNNNDVLTPVGVVGAVETPLPDLNARLFLKNERGHVQVGGFAGTVTFDPSTGSSDDVFLWGFNVSAKIQTVEKDNAIVQATWGDGVGRYRGGATAAPDSGGDLEAIGVFGILGSYQHFWDDEWRSSAGYSWATADLPSGAPATANERIDYFFVNVIWQFSERSWTGLEYMHGSRDTEDHAYGGAHRLQASIRFDL